MKSKLTIAVVALVLGFASTVPLLAQPESKPAETLGIGVSGGLVSASGFSFRKMPSAGIGHQVGLMYLKSSSTTFFNLGYETLYIMKRTRSTALYGIAGLAYIYSRDKVDGYWDYSTFPSRWIPESNDYSRGFAGGAGIGVALKLGGWDQVWCSVDLLLTAYHDTVLPYPQGALHYFFR